MDTLIVIFLITWSVSSIIWFFNSLGHRNTHINVWYDLFMGLPVLCFAFVIGFFGYIAEWVDNLTCKQGEHHV
jgi:hypothetical protein